MSCIVYVAGPDKLSQLIDLDQHRLHGNSNVKSERYKTIFDRSGREIKRCTRFLCFKSGCK